jgi:hypothetical protein
VQPVCARACAELAYGGGDGITPGRGGRPGARDQLIDALLRGLGLDQAAQAEADVPALVALDALRTLAHSGQRAVGQVVEQRGRPGVEDDSLEQHVVEADALAQPRFTRRELRGHRRQHLLEELEDLRRGVLAGRRSALGGGLAGQPEYLCRDAVEESRVALFVAALQGEGPGNQALLGGQGLPIRRGDERRELLGDRVLGYAEAGEEGRQAVAPLVGQLRPCADVGGEVDGRRIPLLAGRDPGEEAGPEAAVCEGLQPADELVLPERGVGQGGTPGVPALLRIHGATVASALRRFACPRTCRGRAARSGAAGRAR